jgi:RNA polymerase sigma-70 factor (ECF subfamily)
VVEDKQLQQLIKGCLEGDRKAQQAVYKLLYGKMKVVCMRYTRDTDQALDILQEGFIKVFQNMERYSGAGSFEGWVRRIMVNLSIDRFRKQKNDFLLLNGSMNIEDYEDVVEDETDVESVDYDFTPEQILEAMQQLSPAYKTVFNLYVFENYTHQDIAEALSISIGTSKSNFAKAKRNMKKILLKYYGKADE